MLLTVRPASSWSLEVYVIFYQSGKSLIAILCLLVAHSLLVRYVRTKFKNYFFERDNVRIFHEERITGYARWSY